MITTYFKLCCKLIFIEHIIIIVTTEFDVISVTVQNRSMSHIIIVSSNTEDYSDYSIFIIVAKSIAIILHLCFCSLLYVFLGKMENMFILFGIKCSTPFYISQNLLKTNREGKQTESSD